MKKAKKGWLKIFEASISITLIMGFIVLVYSQSIQRPSHSESLLKWEESVLDEVKSDPILRDAVINTPEVVCDPEQGGGIYAYIRDKIIKNFPGFGFSCRVCEIDEACGPIDPPDYRPEIYSEERIIASTLTKFAPKKLKIFVWPLNPEEQEPEEVPDACISVYDDCDDWTECINGKKTQTCRDTACNEPARTSDPVDCEVEPGEDTTAPGIVTGFLCGVKGDLRSLPVTCDWENPTDKDLTEVIVVVNGNPEKTFTSDDVDEGPLFGAELSYKSGSEISSRGTYTILIHTKDSSGNVNTESISTSCSVTADQRYMCQ